MLRSTINNLLLPNLVLPLVDRLSDNKAWSHVRRFQAADREDPETRRRRQWRKVQATVEHAYQHTLFYRQRMDDAGLTPARIQTPADLRRLPVTTQQDLRANFPDGVLAQDMDLARVRISSTSGTSGTPLVLAQDHDDINHKYASKVCTRQMMGVGLGDRVLRLAPHECQPCLGDGSSPDVSLTALLRMRLEGSPDYDQARYIFLERKLVNRFIHQRTFPPPLVPNFLETGLERYLQQLKTRRPQVLTGHPIYLYLVARLAERRGVRLGGIRAIDCTGDLSTAALRAYLSRQFHAPIFQVYGGCEWGRLAGACSESGGLMHLIDDLAYVEFITPSGEPAGPGELGNIIVTGLTNRAMPLIRYEQGDVGHYTDEPCPCGRTSRRMDVEGRIHGLIMRGGRPIPASTIMRCLLPERGVRLFQLDQVDEDRFDLAYLPDPEDPPDADALGAEVAQVLGAGAKVTTRISDIFKTAPSGKYRLVRSNSYETFRCVDRS